MEASGQAECASCKQPLAGRYCSNCGEKAMDPQSQTVRQFVKHTLHQAIDLDGKVLQTMRRLILHPAFLTAEYCAGRRRLYVLPVRLLLIAVVSYALLTRAGGLQISLFIGGLVLSVAPSGIPEGTSIAETVARIDRFGILHGILAVKDKAVLEAPGITERFHDRLNAFAEPLSFTNVFLLALVLYVVFHRKREFFFEHAVFSMHLLSFVLLSSLMFLPAPVMIAGNRETIGLATILIVTAWQFVYMAVAIRRFYFGSDRRRFQPGLLAVATAAVIYVLNSAFITGVQLFGGALALWTI